MLIVVVAIAMIAPVPGHAIWIAPQRPLSDKEWLAYEISDADAVGLGQVLAVHDTVVDIGPDGSGFASRTVSLHVEQWLKGAGPSNIVAGVSMLSEAPFPWNAASGIEGVTSPLQEPWVVFMLRHSPNGWGIMDGPGPGTGVRSIPRESRDSLCAAIRRCVAEQNPDTLLRQADVVFIGHAIRTHPCISGSLRCTDVAVDRALGGSILVGQKVSVFTPLGDLMEQRMLYVLRLGSNDVYLPLGQLSGNQRLKDGIAERWRISVEEVARRYKLLH